MKIVNVRKLRKFIIQSVILAAFISIPPLQALADEEVRHITSVSVVERYKASETIDMENLTVTSESMNYSAKIIPLFDAADIKPGDSLTYTIKLTAEEGNDFKGLKLNACNTNYGKIKELTLSDDKKRAVMTYFIKELPILLPEPAQLRWNGKKAEWDAVPDADSYVVSLYYITNKGKLSLLRAQYTVKETYCDMEKDVLNYPADYIFRVQAVPLQGTYFMDSAESELDYDLSLLITEKDIGLYKGFWKKVNEKYSYKDPDIGYLKNGFYFINGNYYYFDEDAYRATGPREVEGKNYYFDLQSGIMYKGWHTIDEKQFYFDETGEQHSGWLNLENDVYYISENGLVTGWNKIYNKVYYFDQMGRMNHNIMVDSKGGIYLFRKDGSLSRKIDGRL